MARKNSTPTKPEMAEFKAMADMGLTNYAIAKKTGRDQKTVKKYLNSDVYHDPEVTRLVEIIKEKEVSDLFLLGAKARNHLHTLLDEGKMKAIETVATMDRSFQQRRLLEGQSTDNLFAVIDTIEKIREYKKTKDDSEV